MQIYLDILKNILENGVDRNGRNGMTRAMFAIQMRFNLENGFPAMTTKKLAFRAVKGELLWFLEGSSDENRLRQIMGSDRTTRGEVTRTIWTDNAYSNYWKPKAKFDGDLGRIYVFSGVIGNLLMAQ